MSNIVFFLIHRRDEKCAQRRYNFSSVCCGTLWVRRCLYKTLLLLILCVSVICARVLGTYVRAISLLWAVSKQRKDACESVWLCAEPEPDNMCISEIYICNTRPRHLGWVPKKGVMYTVYIYIRCIRTTWPLPLPLCTRTYLDTWSFSDCLE